MGNTIISYLNAHGHPIPPGYDPTMQNFGASTPREKQTQIVEFQEQYAKEGNFVKFSPSGLLVGKLSLSDKEWAKSTFMKVLAFVCAFFEIVIRVKGVVIFFCIDVYKGFKLKCFSLKCSKANACAILDLGKMLVNYLNKGGK